MHQRRVRGSQKALSSAAPVSALLVLSALAVACGSRGPLDVDIIQLAPDTDAGATPVVDSGQDATVVVDAGPKPVADTGPSVDANPPREAGVVNCGLCVAQSCGSDIVTCVTDQECLGTLQCVATKCLGGGGSPDPSCFLTCGSGKGLVQILRIFRCITDTCGPECGDILGGLGGLGGFPGGNRIGESRPSGPGSAPRDEANHSGNPGSRDVGRVLFSQYPELCTKTE
jgi:hypothetical protein